MNKSTHECPVIELNLEKHPNADKLSIVRVDDANRVVINTEQWQGKTRAAFIPGQNFVDVTRQEFSFMAPSSKDGKWALVKYCKLRGVRSDGILVPTADDAVIGTNMAESLGVLHKEDEPEEKSQDIACSPKGYNLSKYDIDGAKHFVNEFNPDDEVVCTIKYHGQNCKYLFKDEVMYCGGRTQWLKENKGVPIWAAYYNYPQIGVFCRENPELVLWGECIMQGKYTYGHPQGYRAFYAFDICHLSDGFFNYDDFLILCTKYNIPVVKEIYRGPYLSHNKIVELAETLPREFTHEHEGVVVKPVINRQTRKFERLIYKVISSQFKG